MIKDLGTKLKLARIQNNLTRDIIAKRLGISVTTVGLYETGQRQPSLENLIKLSAIYKVSVDYLLGTDTNQRNIIYVDGLTSKQINCIKSFVDCFKTFDNSYL